jgi:hypothetical protein
LKNIFMILKKIYKKYQEYSDINIYVLLKNMDP